MPVELERIDVHRDINLEKGTITVQGCKGHAGGVLKLKPSLTAALRMYSARYKSFPNAETIGRTWRKYRNRASGETRDQALRKIRLYDLRHYFGTMTYHKTKDIRYVKQQMGHKKIETTMIYTQLVNFNEDEWLSAVAKTVKEARELVEKGFEYVTEIEGVKLFRKRR